jgi:hypothetical protein
VFDRLAPSEQLALAELRADPDFYGVLRPRPGSGRTIRAVGKETALLWLTLQTPGPLPLFALVHHSTSSEDAISSMVLDGILELEEGGQFVSGPKAVKFIGKEPRARPENAMGRLSALSHAAMQYGERLRLNDPGQLAARLYGFGRQPLTPKWQKALPDATAVLAFVGADNGAEVRKRLDSDWVQAPVGNGQSWLMWSNRVRKTSGRGSAVYKLYVSPDIHSMRQAFAAVLEVAGRRALSFKIGSDASGLLRPDKVVLYFSDKESLFTVASELESLVSGSASHGVPFSAEITSDGMLSWGMDPPDSERVLTWQEPESWRLWLVRRLAVAMIAAQTDSSTNVPPSAFALERLRREGVDVDGWTPSPSIWRAK